MVPRSISTALTCALVAASASLEVGGNSTLTLDGGGGLSWRLVSNGSAWSVGQPLLEGAPLDPSSVDDGIAFWRRTSDFFLVPLFGSFLSVSPDRASANLSGSALLPGGVSTNVTVSITAHGPDVGAPAASLTASFSASADIPAGWQLCVKFSHDGPNAGWRAMGYPYATNSSEYNGRLDYMGNPGFWLIRPDASVVVYYSLAARDDYANPGTWTGATTFAFTSGEGGGYQIAPQFMLGGGGFAAGTLYSATTRILAARADGDTLAAARVIVPALLRLDEYAVEPLAPARSPGDMLACFLNARRGTPMWKTTPAGTAYQLQDIAEFIYLGTTPESAYFEYEMWRATGDALWRNRSFAQMDFWLGGQLRNASSSLDGAFVTTYLLPNGPYTYMDRANPGWKLDMNAHMARCESAAAL